MKKTMTAAMVVLVLLVNTGAAFAQEPTKPDTKPFNTGLGIAGLATVLVGGILMVPMKDPDATDVNLSGSSYCVTTNTERQRVDVTSHSCEDLPTYVTAGLITMGAGAVMTFIGFHKVKVAPIASRSSVGANVSVKW